MLSSQWCCAQSDYLLAPCHDCLTSRVKHSRMLIFVESVMGGLLPCHAMPCVCVRLSSPNLEIWIGIGWGNRPSSLKAVHLSTNLPQSRTVLYILYFDVCSVLFCSVLFSSVQFNSTSRTMFREEISLPNHRSTARYSVVQIKVIVIV